MNKATLACIAISITFSILLSAQDNRKVATTSPAVDFPPAATLQQLMRGVMFPNSNIIFTVQTHDPAEKKKPGDRATADGGFNWSAWGTDLYSGWEIVDYAAI